MLDILIPVHHKNLSQAEDCIAAIEANKPGCAYRIVVAFDGVSRRDRGRLESFLESLDVPEEPDPVGRADAYHLSYNPPPREKHWEWIDWPGEVYWRGTVERAMSRVRSEFLLVLPPWVELRDPKWFGKLQHPFVMDPQTMLVALPDPGAPPGTLPPARFGLRKHPGVDAFLTKSSVMRQIMPLMQKTLPGAEVGEGPVAWLNEFSRVAETLGGTRWLAPSVRYYAIEHEKHECPSPQPELSETPEQTSESPSQTTPASSSPTTTEAGGSEVSAPF